MDQGTDVFSCKCSERDGEVIRHVRFLPISRDVLLDLWEKLRVFPTLFAQPITSFEEFVRCFIREDSSGNIMANGLVWKVDDVGILYLTDIYPGYQATGHFTFWDQRLRGREPVLRSFIRYIFEEYGFHRFVCEVPLYSLPTLHAIQRAGFVREGQRRKSVWYKGHWVDSVIFSILKEEIDGTETRSNGSNAESGSIGN